MIVEKSRTIAYSCLLSVQSALDKPWFYPHRLISHIFIRFCSIVRVFRGQHSWVDRLKVQRGTGHSGHGPWQPKTATKLPVECLSQSWSVEGFIRKELWLLVTHGERRGQRKAPPVSLLRRRWRCLPNRHLRRPFFCLLNVRFPPSFQLFALKESICGAIFNGRLPWIRQLKMFPRVQRLFPMDPSLQDANH